MGGTADAASAAGGRRDQGVHFSSTNLPLPGLMAAGRRGAGEAGGQEGGQAPCSGGTAQAAPPTPRPSVERCKPPQLSPRPASAKQPSRLVSACAAAAVPRPRAGRRLTGQEREGDEGEEQRLRLADGDARLEVQLAQDALAGDRLAQQAWWRAEGRAGRGVGTTRTRAACLLGAHQRSFSKVKLLLCQKNCVFAKAALAAPPLCPHPSVQLTGSEAQLRGAAHEQLCRGVGRGGRPGGSGSEGGVLSRGGGRGALASASAGRRWHQPEQPPSPAHRSPW